MSDFLTKILISTRRDLEERRRTKPLAKIKRVLEEIPAGDDAPARRGAGLFKAAVEAPGISVIAEVKRASPSKGDIRPGLDVADVVRQYESGGARAISVLTEEHYFKGSLEDLREARRSTTLPVLRKDFIIDPYQVWEAAAAGADACLLIVAALSPRDLKLLIDEANVAGLDSLVEVHTRGELETALSAGAPIIGINNRDLITFEVNLQATRDLIKSVPDSVPVVSESGIKNRGDMQMLAAAGVGAALIGESLMRSSKPGDRLRDLLVK
ncbi:MAG: indole-3-glycerol phosphate synthase TrpC [Thermoleophilia bacterium]|nr:indole-3-glycerol phosphate synthase TrpC [Thermoleophilia bacterium]